MTIKFQIGDIVKVVKIVVDYQESCSGIRTSLKNHVGKIIDIRDVGKLPLPSIKIRFNLGLGIDDYFDYICYPDELAHASDEEKEWHQSKEMALKL
jgi:hypothetical protein